MLILPILGYCQAHTPASPYGETKLVHDFICSEMVYPDAALKSGQQGEVVLKFEVNAAGKVSNIRVKQGVSPEIDREAIRVFRLLQWKPAIRLGNPVSSEEEYSFKFNIKKYNRVCKQRGYEKQEKPYLPVDTSLVIYGLENVDKTCRPIFDTKGMTLEKFIDMNLLYPEAAFKQDISGQVVLSFVVETDGVPSNVLIISPLAGGCTEEAIRIMRLVRWMPAIKDGMAVRSRNELSITFKLDNENKHKVYDNNQAGSI